MAAAAQAQRSLAAQPWPDGRRCCVRMGLHTGEATVAGGGYVGLAVHRAARIAAAAAGGRCSSRRRPPRWPATTCRTATSLRALGEHRLKDFPQPAALYQLDVAGLPTRVPAAARPCPGAARPSRSRRGAAGPGGRPRRAVARC